MPSDGEYQYLENEPTCNVYFAFHEILLYGGLVMMLLGTVGNLSAAFVTVVKSKEFRHCDTGRNT